MITHLTTNTNEDKLIWNWYDWWWSP